MLKDHLSFDKRLYIELFLENSVYQTISFRRFEPLKEAARRISKIKSLVPVLKLNFQILLFCLFVEQIIVEEDKDHDFLLRLKSVAVLNETEVEAGKLVNENLFSTPTCKKNVVGLLRPLRGRVECIK